MCCFLKKQLNRLKFLITFQHFSFSVEERQKIIWNRQKAALRNLWPLIVSRNMATEERVVTLPIFLYFRAFLVRAFQIKIYTFIRFLIKWYTIIFCDHFIHENKRLTRGRVHIGTTFLYFLLRMCNNLPTPIYLNGPNWKKNST
jgi:hypothetical protein